MKEEEFIIWLHGFFEISNTKSLDENQTAIIKKKLAEFFQKTALERSPLEDLNKYKTSPVDTPLIPPAQTPDWPNFPTYPLTTEPAEPYWKNPVWCNKK